MVLSGKLLKTEENTHAEWMSHPVMPGMALNCPDTVKNVWNLFSPTLMELMQTNFSINQIMGETRVWRICPTDIALGNDLRR